MGWFVEISEPNLNSNLNFDCWLSFDDCILIINMIWFDVTICWSWWIEFEIEFKLLDDFWWSYLNWKYDMNWRDTLLNLVTLIWIWLDEIIYWKWWCKLNSNFILDYWMTVDDCILTPNINWWDSYNLNWWDTLLNLMTLIWIWIYRIIYWKWWPKLNSSFIFDC